MWLKFDYIIVFKRFFIFFLDVQFFRTPASNWPIFQMFSSDAMSTSFTNHLQFRPKYCNFPLNLEITTNTSDFLLNFGKGKFKERSLSRFNRFFESKTQSSVDEGRSTNSCDCSLSGANEKESENGIEEEDDSFDLTQEIDLTDQVGTTFVAYC